MRKLSLFLVLSVSALLSTANADTPETHYGKSAAMWYIERTDKIVDLSGEQKKEITALFEARDKAIKEFQASIEGKAKAIAAELAEAARQKKEVNAHQAYQALYAPMHEVMKKTETALQNVLTDKQRARLRDENFVRAVRRYTGTVEMSVTQFNAIRSAVADGDPEISRHNIPQVIDKVLNSQQIALAAKQQVTMFSKAWLGRLELTREQSAKIDALVAEVAESNAKSVQLNHAAYEKVKGGIDSVLTAEQKAALKSQHELAGSAAAGAHKTETRHGSDTNRNPSSPAPSTGTATEAESLRREVSALRKQVAQLQAQVLELSKKK